MRATKAIINLSAIKHNLAQIKRLAPHSKVMAVIKADAYGHGIVEVAKSLENAELLAVACMKEAQTLRQANIKAAILLLEGFFDKIELAQALEFNLETVIHHQKQVEELLALAQRRCNQVPLNQTTAKPINVWLKLDTGMNRLGFEPAAFVAAYQALVNCPLVGSINVMSHLACADDIDNSMTIEQVKQFKQTINGLQAEASLANSAGVIAWPESHFDWVRPGIALFGCSPMMSLNGASHHFIPAMTLQSQLMAIHSIEQGQTVGYGASWQCQQTTRIGIVSIGYGDGYPRHAQENTPVWINGKCYPLVGKVSMDMSAVDLGLEDEFIIGDKVVLWGPELPVETIAACANTIPYTLLCGVTSRVPLEYIGQK